ncbi:MAG: purine-binding chemotaxis protein CheW [Magnetococcales bacterium]|nr:purine-binding chemotaxis protein CheW [Magnetococcales bacterium]
MEPFADLHSTDLDELDEMEPSDLLLEDVKDCIQLVTFRLGGEKYGMDVLQVQEIIRYSEPTPVPNMPDFIRGVTNLRGTILPVLDLRTRFRMSPCHYGSLESAIILIAHVDTKQVGIIADAVADVLFFPKKQISPPPELFSQVDTEFIQGMGEMRGELLILLNLEKILSAESLKKYGMGSGAVDGLSVVPGEGEERP